jgi:hypothetical protein
VDLEDRIVQGTNLYAVRASLTLSAHPTLPSLDRRLEEGQETLALEIEVQKRKLTGIEQGEALMRKIVREAESQDCYFQITAENAMSRRKVVKSL